MKCRVQSRHFIFYNKKKINNNHHLITITIFICGSIASTAKTIGANFIRYFFITNSANKITVPVCRPSFFVIFVPLNLILAFTTLFFRTAAKDNFSLNCFLTLAIYAGETAKTLDRLQFFMKNYLNRSHIYNARKNYLSTLKIRSTSCSLQSSFLVDIRLTYFFL